MNTITTMLVAGSLAWISPATGLTQDAKSAATAVPELPLVAGEPAPPPPARTVGAGDDHAAIAERAELVRMLLGEAVEGYSPEMQVGLLHRRLLEAFPELTYRHVPKPEAPGSVAGELPEAPGTSVAPPRVSPGEDFPGSRPRRDSVEAALSDVETAVRRLRAVLDMERIPVARKED